MKELEDFIAHKLLMLKAIKLQAQNPFEWNNGWISPVYFDSRKILSYKVRNVVKVELARVIVEKYPEAEAIAAVAPNGIAMGILVAEVLDMPFVYVSSQPKSHGFENRIEGDLKLHQKVVILADQIAQGTNSISVQEALVQNGADVVGMVSLLDYEFAESTKALRRARLDYYSLTTFTMVLKKALEMERINAQEAEIINAWHRNPADWSAPKADAGKHQE